MYVQGQVVVGSVDLVDYCVELVVFLVDYVQDWIEDFFLQLVQVFQFICVWCEEGVVGGFGGQFGGGDQVCFVVYVFGVVLQDFQCVGIDYWVDVGGQQVWVVDFQFFYCVGQYGYYFVSDVVLYEQYVCG